MQKQEQSNGDAAFRWCPGSSSRSTHNIFDFAYRISIHTQVENGNFRPSIRFLEHHSVTSPPTNQKKVTHPKFCLPFPDSVMKIMLGFLFGPVSSQVGFNVCMHAQSLQSCLTLCDLMDYSPPVSSVHGVLQARILKWVVMPSSRGSS